MKQLSLVLVSLFSFAVMAEQHGGINLPPQAIEALKQKSKSLTPEKYELFQSYVISACTVARPAVPQRSPGISPSSTSPNTPAGQQGSAPQSTPSSGTLSSSTPQTNTASSAASSIIETNCRSCHGSKGEAAELAAIARGYMNLPNGEKKSISDILTADQVSQILSK